LCCRRRKPLDHDLAGNDPPAVASLEPVDVAPTGHVHDRLVLAQERPDAVALGVRNVSVEIGRVRRDVVLVRDPVRGMQLVCPWDELGRRAEEPAVMVERSLVVRRRDQLVVVAVEPTDVAVDAIENRHAVEQPLHSALRASLI
jgi:hypothetical protein